MNVNSQQNTITMKPLNKTKHVELFKILFKVNVWLYDHHSVRRCA